MNWNDPRRALPADSPSQEKSLDSEVIRELRQAIRDLSREMGFRSPKASITMAYDGYIKEITVEGFVV